MQEKNLKNNVLSGLFWKFSERILAQGVSFVVSVVLSRLLLPEHYGVVALVLIFINLANVFVTSGFSSSLVQKKDANDTDFSTIFYCSLAMSLLIYVILFFASPLIAKFYRNDLLTPVIRVIALKLPLASYNSVQHAYVQRHMIFKRFFFSTLIGTIISGIVGIIMALKGFGVWSLVAQYLTNSTIDMIVLMITVKWRPRLLFSVSSAKKLTSFGWKVLAADLSGALFTQLRSLIIGRVYTAADLAYYNKGKQFPSLLTTNISATIISVLFPAFANLSDNTEKVKSVTRRAVNIISYILMPLLFGLGVTARPLVILLLTEKWLDAVPFIQILSISSAIGIISDISLQSMKALGRSDVLLKIEFIKKPVFFVLLVIGVRISVIAVAVTMVIYTLYSTIVNANQLCRLIKYTFKEQLIDLAAPILLSFSMAVCAYMPSVLIPDLHPFPLLIIQVIIGVIYYVFISKLLKIEAYKYIINTIRNLIKKNNT